MNDTEREMAQVRADNAEIAEAIRMLLAVFQAKGREREAKLLLKPDEYETYRKYIAATSHPRPCNE